MAYEQTTILLEKNHDNAPANGVDRNSVTATVTINGNPAPDLTPVSFHVTGSALWLINEENTFNDSTIGNTAFGAFYDTNTAGETVSVTATCNGVTSDPLEFTFAPYNQHTQTTVTLSKAMDEQPADGRSLNRADATVNINGASAPNGTQVTFSASGHARFAFSNASIYTTSTSGGSAAAPFYDTNPNGETVTITAASGGSTSNPLTFTFEPSIVPLTPIVILNPYEGEDIIIPINIGQHGPVYASGTATAGQVLNFLLNWQPFGSSTVNSAGNWTSPPIHDSGNLTLSVSYASEGQNAPRWTVHFSVEYSDT